MPGRYAQAATGELEVQLGGTVPGVDLGALRVGGPATLGGTLRVSLAAGFVPAEGSVFHVVSTGSRTGAFATIAGLDLGGGLVLEPDYTATGLDLVAGTVAGNRPPVARSDTGAVDEDASVAVPVLANDTDPDGDALVISDFTAAAHGTVVAGAPGILVYTPAPDFHGSDSFSYTIRDGRGGEATATVSLTIAAVPDAPRPAADTVTTAEDTPVVVTPLGNDADPDGGTLSLIGFTAPAHGAVVNDGDGTLTYTPAADFHGTDTFTYTVAGAGGVATGAVTVAVTPSADPPEAGDDTAATLAATPVSILVLANDTDVDGDVLTIASVDTTGAAGVVAIAPDRRSLTFTPGAAFIGTDVFSYTVSDGHGGTDSAAVTVTVTAAATADLEVTAIDGPTGSLVGHPAVATVTWTVTNTGDSAGTASTWVDRVRLSTDAVLGNADDVTLAEASRSGALAPGASYVASRTVTLPLGLTGTVRLYVQADAASQVPEFDGEGNNASAPLVVDLADGFADLQVEAVSAPATGRSGEPVAIAWRVRNLGTTATDASAWVDRVFLSADATLDAGDTLLVTAPRSGALAAGSSYTASVTTALPHGIEGVYLRRERLEPRVRGVAEVDRPGHGARV